MEVGQQDKDKFQAEFTASVHRYGRYSWQQPWSAACLPAVVDAVQGQGLPQLYTRAQAPRRAMSPWYEPQRVMFPGTESSSWARCGKPFLLLHQCSSLDCEIIASSSMHAHVQALHMLMRTRGVLQSLRLRGVLTFACLQWLCLPAWRTCLSPCQLATASRSVKW
jgi:hypothetical protein